MKSKLEYIWLDGFQPTQSLRSKTQMSKDNFTGALEDVAMWSFDGSSTEQAEGGSSDCLLKPVAIYPDPDRHNAYLVMCEVLNADGTPHPSNGRATIEMMTTIYGLVSSKNISCGMSIHNCLLAFLPAASQRHRVPTTVPSVPVTPTAVTASKSILIFV